MADCLAFRCTQRSPLSPWLGGILLIALLSGCSGFSFDDVSTIFSPGEGPPLPGDRIAVLPRERDLEPDRKIRDLPVRLPRPQANTNWPSAGGAPDHANHHLQVPEELSVAWTKSIGKSSNKDRRMTATPIAFDGVIYTMDIDARVSAFDAETGKALWRTKLVPKDEDDSFGGGIAYNEGRIFVTSGFAQVIAINAEDGEEIWRTSMPGPMRNAPAVSNGRVFAITIDNQVHALDAATGARLWNHIAIAESASLLGAASPAVSGEVLIAPFSSGELIAFRAESGRVVWSENLSSASGVDAISALADIRGLPVVDRGTVFAVSHSGRTVAIDLQTGARAWELELGGIQTPWVAGDFIYVLSNESVLFCITRRGGRVRWVTPLERFENPERNKGLITWVGPTLASDRLIVISDSGMAMSISPYTGEYLSMLELPGPVTVPPIVADGTLYMITDNAKLIAMR